MASGVRRQASGVRRQSAAARHKKRATPSGWPFLFATCCLVEPAGDSPTFGKPCISEAYGYPSRDDCRNCTHFLSHSQRFASSVPKQGVELGGAVDCVQGRRCSGPLTRWPLAGQPSVLVGLCGTEKRAVERKGGEICMIIGVSQVGSWLAGLASAVQMPSGGHSLDASTSNLIDAP